MKGLISIFLLLLLMSCRDNCTPLFFTKNDVKDTANLRSIFKNQVVNTNNLGCVYQHEFTFWKGFSIDDQFVPFFHLKGLLYKEGSVVKLSIDSGNTIKYFDFSMPIDSPELVVLKQSKAHMGKQVSRTLKYNLVLENKFFDSSIKDTVYKFRFDHLGIITNDGDLVVFVTLNYGVIGACVSDVISNVEEIFEFRGNIYYNQPQKYLRRYVRGNIL